MVVVADGEGIGQRELIRQVPPGVIRHRRHALVRHPAVVLAGVPRGVRVGPAVRGVGQERLSEILDIGAEGQQEARAVGLMPHGSAGGQLHRARVGEAAHAAHRAEVVVEGSVLLHEDDDVLDVVDRPGAVVGGDGEGPAEIERRCRRHGGRSDELQEVSAVCGMVHGRPPHARDAQCGGRLATRYGDGVSAIRRPRKTAERPVMWPAALPVALVMVYYRYIFG